MFVFIDINLPASISLFPILHACMYVCTDTLYIIDVINLNKYFMTFLEIQQYPNLLLQGPFDNIYLELVNHYT